MPQIRVGVVGVGNCAAGLIQAVDLVKSQQVDPKHAHPAIGGYEVSDIDFASAFDVGSLYAFCQLATSKSPRIVLALIGRFRWRPPLKLYATLRAKPPPRSRSMLRFACCAYA